MGSRICQDIRVSDLADGCGGFWTRGEDFVGVGFGDVSIYIIYRYSDLHLL